MKTQHLFLAIFVNLAASQAFAGIPTLPHKCGGVVPQVKHPDNGTKVEYDETCKTAYILPPATGTAELKSLARNANLQFCPAVLKAGKTSESLANSAELIAKRIETMISEYEPLQQQLASVSDQLNAAEAEATTQQARFEFFDNQKRELVGEYQVVKSDLESCTLFGNDCTELTAKKRALEIQILDIKKQADQAQLAKIAADSKVAQLRSQKLRMESDLTQATGNLLALLGQLDTVNNTVMNTYKTWAAMEAATAQLVYSVNWKSLVNQYADLNPAFAEKGITFTPVTIVDGQFFGTVKVKSSADAPTTLPGLLSAVIPGTRAYGVNNLGAPGTIQTIPASVTDAEQASQSPDLNEALLKYSTGGAAGGATSVSGQVQLSLLGACAYFPEGLNSPPRETVSAKDLAAYLVVNAQLGYDVKVTRKYKASFNLSKLVERIEEVASKKRWFFKTEDLNKITFTANASSWFDIVFDSESSEHGFEPGEKEKITADVKADLVKRTIDQIAVVTGEAPGVPPFSQSGFDKNPKVPCSAWYCKGFNYLLGVGEGFFGTKTAVSQFKVKNSSWARDSFTDNKVIRQNHNLTFVPVD